MKRSSKSPEPSPQARAEPHRSGFVSLLAPPNAGKSTLLNALVGQKIAITSPKPNTTRTRITGILTDARQQLVFLDTPGILASPTGLNTRLVARALNTISETDVAVLLQEAPRQWVDVLTDVAAQLRRNHCPIVVGLTKIDLLENKKSLLPLIEEAAAKTGSEHIIPMCAPRRDGLDALLDVLYSLVPEGPQYFAEDMVTDQPERVIVAELIRETLLMMLRQEVPYASAVEIGEFRDPADMTGEPQRRDEKVYIRACIFVEGESQKGIIIGKGGRQLRALGTQARTKIERFLGAPVYLDVVVRVASGWRSDERYLDRFGL